MARLVFDTKFPLQKATSFSIKLFNDANVSLAIGGEVGGRVKSMHRMQER
jgi:hypothetical protein